MTTFTKPSSSAPKTSRRLSVKRKPIRWTCLIPQQEVGAGSVLIMSRFLADSLLPISSSTSKMAPLKAGPLSPRTTRSRTRSPKPMNRRRTARRFQYLPAETIKCSPSSSKLRMAPTSVTMPTNRSSSVLQNSFLAEVSYRYRSLVETPMVPCQKPQRKSRPRPMPPRE